MQAKVNKLVRQSEGLLGRGLNYPQIKVTVAGQKNNEMAQGLSSVWKNTKNCLPEEAKPVLSIAKEGPLYLI
jgi:hypothetical protein